MEDDVSSLSISFLLEFSITATHDKDDDEEEDMTNSEVKERVKQDSDLWSIPRHKLIGRGTISAGTKARG